MPEPDTALQERIAHLERAVDDLSDALARQDREVDALRRRVALLLDRAAEAEAGQGGTVPLADQRPPHW